ncbi:MAG: hypothetical protein K2X44_11535 [Magnetospirillum sp.]|nr:hypothetical protein [Magnetospirillum sp.]
MSRPVFIAIIGFATAAAALGLAMSLDSGDRREAAVPLPPVQAGPQASIPPTRPAFDVVRIGEKGDAVLAGRAQPKAEIVLLDGERELGRVPADERGEWVFVPTLPMASGIRVLMVEAHGAEGGITRADNPVIVVVPENSAEPALAVAPLAEGGARLMMAPHGDAEPVTVDLVDRDEAGRLFMGGRALPGALIHLYMDNKFLGRVQADGEGGWRLAIQAAQGRALRADLVEANGKVLARLEVPLEPEPVQTAAAGGDNVVVEPGASLWKIARRLYGSGPGSTVVYQASKDRMRDPDSVYPGQVFQVTKN